MWPYWLMFLLAAGAAMTETRPRAPAATMRPQAMWTLSWVVAGLGLALLIGYRVEVGGDWFNYFNYLDSAVGASLTEVLLMDDPGFRVLNWVSVQMDWDVFGVNVLSGLIFAAGLVVFCRSLRRPWLALTIAIPYLVIVVGMGYSRQAIALALAMIGLVALQRKSTAWFIFWVVLGATFHKTAVLLLPIGALVQTERKVFRVLLIAVATVSAYFVLLADVAGELYVNYVEAGYESEGALLRLLMNAVPATILLLQWRRFRETAGLSTLWLWFAWLSVVLLAVLFASPASTAVDRLALYMLPLQLVVFSAFPDALMRRGQQGAILWVGTVLLYYATVLFVWLHYATHSEYWLPYRFYPFEALL